MAIVTQYNLELKQMKVKIVFLYEDVEETIYIEKLKSFVEDNLYNKAL